jgi:formate dehydrogenase subunit gamma
MVKESPRAASSSQVDGTSTDVIDRAIADHRDLPGALLPILHAIQDRLGFIPPAAARQVAEGLNLSHADVQGVISFYHDFRAAPPGRHVVKLCRAEACQSMGAQALEARVKARLGIDFGQTSRDGAITLEPVYCLGNCALSPALMIDNRLQGRVTPERLEALLAPLEEKS